MGSMTEAFLAKESFDLVWKRIAACEGQEFQTPTGLAFSYSVNGKVLRPSRTGYNLSRSGFEKAWDLLPSATRRGLNTAVRGPSYVIAILTDPRVTHARGYGRRRVPKPKTALILGAGFSCEAGLPSTRKIVETFLESPRNGELDPQIEEEISLQLRKFWKYAFNFDGHGELPSLEDHFTVIDLAANTGRNIGPEYTPRKLRAIRRLSIHRVFQILDLKYQHSVAIEQLLRSLGHVTEVAVVSTNWDIVVENHLRSLPAPYWYGLPVENLEGIETPSSGMKLLMLHGSANWIYCDSCRRLYAGQSDDGKAALRTLIYIDTDDFRELCPANKAVIGLLFKTPRQPKKCLHCENRLGARIATFSYRKEVSIPQFQTVWQQAYSVLRDSDTWLFIGYSLPEADFEFRHLLKSAEKAVPASTAKNIRVILKEDCEAGRRFRRFFGIADEQIHQHGLSDCMRDCLPVSLGALTKSKQ